MEVRIGFDGLISIVLYISFIGLFPNDANPWRLVREHVKTDLDAYVCLFEECNEPAALYKHGEHWLNHMRQHTLHWRCNARSHGIQQFDSKCDYENHMRNVHMGTFTEAQLPLLTERNARSIEPLFTSCPFCGGSDATIKGRLEDHIVGHLRYLALRSLPRFESHGNEMSNDEDTVSSGRRWQSQSTIRNDLDRGVWPTFENDDEWQQPSDLTDHGDTSSRALEWGFIPAI